MWKRLFFKADGTVSVFLLLILVPMFLFQAVFVDLIRFKLAERESERAVKASVRSLLAEYQTELRPYGLFGRDNQPGELNADFRRGVRQNLLQSNEGERALGTVFTADDGTATGLFSLANQQIFRKQVNEDMKYKAPIEFLLELIEKFRKTNVAGEMSGTAEVFEFAKDLEEKWRAVNTKLDAAWKAAVALTDLAGQVAGSYSAKLAVIQELGDKIGLHTAVELTELLTRLTDSIDQLSSSLTYWNNDLDSKRYTLSDLSRDSEKNREAIISLEYSIGQAEKSLSAMSSRLSSLIEEKNAAEQLLKDIAAYAVSVAEIKAQAAQDDQQLTRLFQEMNTQVTAAQAANEQLRQVKQQLIAEADASGKGGKTLYAIVPVLDNTFFTRYLADGGIIPALFNGFLSQLSSAGIIAGEAGASLSSTLTSMGEANRTFRADRQKLEQERAEQNNKLKTKQEEQQSLLDKTLAEVNSVFGACTLPGNGVSANGQYERLAGTAPGFSDGLYAKYRKYNSSGSTEPGTEGLTMPHSGSTGSLNDVMGLSDKLGRLLTEVRGELYLNEYALSRFTYRTTAEAARTGRSLGGQESEYILYGNASCAGNYASAYGEMFMIFFAVRTIESLTDPKLELLNIGSPLLVFLAAAAKGAGEAYSDMAKLVDGKAVAVVKRYPAMTVTYKDMLRVLFLLHGNDSKMMARMQALIELDSGVDLTTQTTYVRGEAKTSFRLLFLPGVAAALGKSLYGPVEGNRVILHSVAVSDY